MKRTLLGLAALLCCSAASADQFGDFANRVSGANLKPFALDLGGVLGAASAPTGKALGVPGFEAGVTAAMQSRADKDDHILRDGSVKQFGIPLVELAGGLPFGIDLVGHGLKIGQTSVLGGGVRYGIIKPGVVTGFLPSLGVSAFGDRVTHQYFTATHFSANVSATWQLLPILHPFADVGLDSTHVSVRSSVTPGVTGMKATATGSRLSGGLEIAPLPLIRLRAAYVLMHGIPGAQAGLFVSF